MGAGYPQGIMITRTMPFEGSNVKFSSLIRVCPKAPRVRPPSAQYLDENTKITCDLCQVKLSSKYDNQLAGGGLYTFKEILSKQEM
jgi:hypothetical protein